MPETPKILVVGCGDGIEAAVLAQFFDGARVWGVDPRRVFDEKILQVPGVTLLVQDSTALQFPDGFFDFVYAYHVLEHISDPGRALSEMHRVLKPGGSVMIGVPNRARFLAYFGSKISLTFWQKLKPNLRDWATRLRGRFRNIYGAHAGFTRDELAGIMSPWFNRLTDISLEYYRAIYPRFSGFLVFVSCLGLAGPVFPSVYLIGNKPAESPA